MGGVPGGGLPGGEDDGSGVGVTFGVHVAGNGNGVNVQIGVGEPTVQVGQGKSMVGGTAVVMGAPGRPGSG